VLGRRALRSTRLGGGHGASVHRLALEGGDSVVVKTASSGPARAALAVEARMLADLARLSELPVPSVLDAADGVIVMSDLGDAGALDAATQADAAGHVAALHGVAGTTFGLDYDTVIGGLAQANPKEASWRRFFRDHRLLAMARAAHAERRLPDGLRARIERLAERVGEWIEEPEAPSLIHGDLWGGNVLALDGRVTGFVDPAIYFADPEIELAFGTLFGTFDEHFFAAYRERWPIRPGFFEARRDLYNLYPLLVHVRLFGAGYLGPVERTLTRFGV
jgi:fructosamine-3-kinase